jgi:hypothetical protein
VTGFTRESVPVSAISRALRRHVWWAAFSAALLATPHVLIWIGGAAVFILAFLLLPATVGGTGIVLVGLLYAAITRRPADVADRALIARLKAFFYGCALGIAAALFLVVGAPLFPPILRAVAGGLAYGSFLGGGIAMLLVDVLRYPRLTCLVLRACCAAIIALTACGLVGAFR